jgi:hypothetical protein
MPNILFKDVQWLRRLVAGLPPWRPGFATGSFHVGFVVEKVALGHVPVRVLRCPLSISFHHGSPYSYITWAMNNRPVGGRNQRQSYPIDMNNNNNNYILFLGIIMVCLLHPTTLIEMKCMSFQEVNGTGSCTFQTSCLPIHEIQRKVGKTSKEVVSVSYHLKHFLHMQTKW